MSKYTIIDMQNLAKVNGGFCISTKYKNIVSPLNWECKKGHVFTSRPDNIKYKNSWCPICSIEKRGETLKGLHRHTIQLMQHVARVKKGVCLSTTYIDVFTHLLWKCNNGHTWEAMPSNILAGSWCPFCAGVRRACTIKKLSIEDMRKIAAGKKGKCLSKKYTGLGVKLTWSCKKGHVWNATPNSIKNNATWCPICYRKTQHSNRDYYNFYDESLEFWEI